MSYNSLGLSLVFIEPFGRKLLLFLLGVMRRWSGQKKDCKRVITAVLLMNVSLPSAGGGGAWHADWVHVLTCKCDLVSSELRTSYLNFVHEAATACHAALGLQGAGVLLAYLWQEARVGWSLPAASFFSPDSLNIFLQICKFHADSRKTGTCQHIILKAAMEETEQNNL